jgi:hypothetical protein
MNMKLETLSRHIVFVALSCAFGLLPVPALSDAGSTGALAQSTTKRSVCNVDALVNERDPAGLNVRAAPNAQGKILGKLAPVIDDEKTSTLARVEVQILASQDGWFLINGASDNEALTEGLPKRAMYKGKGWVSGKKLTVKSQATIGRAEPSVNASVVFGEPKGNSFDGDVDVDVDAGRLLARKGHWVLIEYVYPKQHIEQAPTADKNSKGYVAPGHVRGWVNRVCGIQETSCDGLRDK